MHFLDLTTFPDISTEVNLGVENLFLHGCGNFIFIYKIPNTNRFIPLISSRCYSEESIANLKLLIDSYPVLVSEHFARSKIYTLNPEDFADCKIKCRLGVKGCELVAPHTIRLGDTYFLRDPYKSFDIIQPYEALMAEWRKIARNPYEYIDSVDVRLVLDYPHLFASAWKCIFERLWQSEQKSFDERFLEHIKDLSSLAKGELSWGIGVP